MSSTKGGSVRFLGHEGPVQVTISAVPQALAQKQRKQRQDELSPGFQVSVLMTPEAAIGLCAKAASSGCGAATGEEEDEDEEGDEEEEEEKRENSSKKETFFPDRAEQEVVELRRALAQITQRLQDVTPEDKEGPLAWTIKNCGVSEVACVLQTNSGKAYFLEHREEILKLFLASPQRLELLDLTEASCGPKALAQKSDELSMICSVPQELLTPELLEKLLRMGADPSLLREGRHPLLEAAERYSLELVNLLLEAVVDVDQESNEEKPRTALQAARGDAVVARLLEAKADPNRPTKTRLTAVHWQARKGNAEELRLVIEAGGNVNALSRSSASPLEFCILELFQNDCAELLLRAGADPNSRIKQIGQRGDTPLIWATRKSKGDLVRMLLQHKANPNICSEDGSSALSVALKSRDREIIGLLIPVTDSKLQFSENGIAKNHVKLATEVLDPHHTLELLKHGYELTEKLQPLRTLYEKDSKLVEKAFEIHASGQDFASAVQWLDKPLKVGDPLECFVDPFWRKGDVISETQHQVTVLNTLGDRQLYGKFQRVYDRDSRHLRRPRILVPWQPLSLPRPKPRSPY